MEFKSSTGTSVPGTIRLKAGESVTGILRGNPYEYEKAFNPGEKPKFRFRVNLVVAENGGFTAKVIEGGWKLYKQFDALQKAGWKLEESYTQISRTGSTKNDTVYSANCTPTKVPADVLKKVSQVELKDLTGGTTEERSEEPDFEQYTAADAPL